MLSIRSSATVDGVPTARERARAELTREILAEAARQLAETGAAGLSLRAVARSLDMASSAIYRYFASRDELLTALLIATYDDLGAVAEAAAADSSRRAPRNRWVDVAAAVRSWALDHPHEYALLYGTPVPGYEAPAATSDSGTRVSRALVGIVADAAEAETLGPVAVDLPAAVRRDLDRLRPLIAFDGVSAEHTFAALYAWTQLFGLVGFELFGQTRGVVTDHEAFFLATAAHGAAQIGLP